MAELTKLGKYELRRELGKGAMGVVYEGFDPFIERTVAIKTVLKSALDGGEAKDALNRFRREAQAAGRLTHPNIVSIYEYGEDQEVAFIAMEFVQGDELKKYFDNQERFQMPEVVRIMSQLLEALDYSHGKGVVHRDIKPANIIITNTGQLKVADFGIARIESSNLTQVGDVMGTPTYMSPEQISGLSVDRRTDIYASGVILYQFLTGERPFTGSSITIMHKVMYQDPVPPSVLNVNVTPALDNVVKKAMAKRLEDRFQTAHEFMEALKAAAAGVPLVAAAVSEAIDPDATFISSGAASPGVALNNTDLDLWKSIKSSQNLDDIRHYLAEYPDGKFVELAKLRITAIEATAKAEAEAEAEAVAKAEHEARLKIAEENKRREREAAEAKARAEEELRRQLVAEEKARLEREAAEARAREAAEVRRLAELEEDARREREAAEARRQAEEDARRQSEANEAARIEREAIELKARVEQEAAELQARIEQEAAEAEARLVAETRRLKDEEERVRRDLEAAEARARAEAEAQRIRDEKEKARLELEAAEAGVRAEVEAQRKRDIEEKAQRVREAAEAKAAAKAQRLREDEEKAQRTREAAAAREQAKAQAKAEARLKKEAKFGQDPDRTLMAAGAAGPDKVAATSKTPVIAIAGGVAVLVVGAGIWLATRTSPEPAPVGMSVPEVPAAPARPIPEPLLPSAKSVDSGVEADAKSRADAETIHKAESEAIRKAESEAKGKPVANADSKRDAEIAAKAKADAKAKVEADAKLKAESEAKLKAELETKAKREAADAETKHKAESEAKAKAESEAKARAESEARARAEAESKRKAEAETKAGAVPAQAVDGGAAYQQGLRQEAGGNIADAVKSYKAAANANYVPAMKKLGDIYGKGAGDAVPRDYAASIKWYNKAKQLGATVDVNTKR